MSNSNVIVPFIFEEIAEEENLFSSERTSFFVGLYPIIDETQVKILEGIIVARAGRLHCSPILLRKAFIDTYRIEELRDLPRHLFDDAVRHLVSFVGVN